MGDVFFFFFTAGDKWKKVECQMKKWKRKDLIFTDKQELNKSNHQIVPEYHVPLPPLAITIKPLKFNTH